MSETSSQGPLGAVTGETIELRLTRTFDAPPDVLFRFWTDPQHLILWWGPEGMSCPHCEMDVRVGGKFRTCMKSEDGTEHWVQGTYREISDGKRLSFTWAWEEDGVAGDMSVVTVEFHPDGNKTRLVLIHQGFPTDSARDNHQWGWNSSLDCLEAQVSAAA